MLNMTHSFSISFSFIRRALLLTDRSPIICEKCVSTFFSCVLVIPECGFLCVRDKFRGAKMYGMYIIYEKV